MNLLTNAKWITISQIVKILIQIISLTVLARLLQPHEYGVMAMATVIINFALIIRDLGTSSVIIQRKELTTKLKSSVYWLNIIMGCGIGLVIIICSPIISSVFHTKQLTLILIFLAFNFPIANATSVQQALLERESKFKLLAGIEIRASCLGLFIAIAMAYSGFGVYSLVAQSLVINVLSSMQLWRISTWKPDFTFDKDEIASVFSFSGNLSIFNIINYFSRNADNIIIGHLFSAAALGAYSLAYRIMLFPIQSMTLIANRSLFPILSRNQDDVIQVKKLYLHVITIIASITAPMMSSLAILRVPFVDFVFGSNWDTLPILLLWLAPTGFLQSIVSTTGSIFMAKNKTNLLVRVGLCSALLQVSAIVVGSQISIEYICKLYFLANIINFMLVLYVVMNLLQGGIIELFVALRAPLISSLLMNVILFKVVDYINIKITLFCFILLIFIAPLVYLLIYRFIFVREFISICPARYHRLMRCAC